MEYVYIHEMGPPKLEINFGGFCESTSETDTIRYGSVCGLWNLITQTKMKRSYLYSKVGNFIFYFGLLITQLSEF